jgi:hypothetical protein
MAPSFRCRFERKHWLRHFVDRTPDALNSVFGEAALEGRITERTRLGARPELRSHLHWAHAKSVAANVIVG